MKKWRVILAASILALLLCVLGTGAWLYRSAHDAAEEIYQPLERETAPAFPQSTPQSQPLSVLILGIDERPQDSGRSDILMLLTFNPSRQSSLLLSIPRDTRVLLPGLGKEDKINHAYAFGGVDWAVESVERFLEIPVHYYVQVNMESFEKIVDLLGGVRVVVDRPFSYDDYTFEGEMRLDGEAALAYVRMRKEDPLGDLGRNQRQQQVLTSLLREGAKLTHWSKAPALLDLIRQYVKTNVGWEQMLQAQQYIGSLEQIHTLQLSGQGKIVDGIYYYLVDEEERKRISKLLRDHLELDRDIPDIL